MDELDPDYTLLEEEAEYALASTLAGDVYLLHSKSERLRADLRDDDGRRFKAGYDELEKRSPDWKADRILAQLWDQGGYSWLAKEEG